jgi:hypothetical protein
MFHRGALYKRKGTGALYGPAKLMVFTKIEVVVDDTKIRRLE